MNNAVKKIKKFLLKPYQALQCLKIELIILIKRKFRPGQINDMMVVISSHVDYFGHTFDKLLTSLMENGISSNRILFFIGGSEIIGVKRLSGVKCHYVQHNSFDLTALIELVDSELNHGFYFLLHDTVLIASSRFSQIVDYYPVKSGMSYSVLKFPSKNIGIYSKEVLQENEKYFSDYKEFSLRNNDIQLLKMKAVETEDVIFKRNSTHHNFMFAGVGEYVRLMQDNFRAGVVKEEISRTGIIKYTANPGKSDIYKVEF